MLKQEILYEMIYGSVSGLVQVKQYYMNIFAVRKNVLNRTW